MDIWLFVAQLMACCLISAGLFSVIDKIRIIVRMRKLAKLKEVQFGAGWQSRRQAANKLEPYLGDKGFQYVPGSDPESGDYKIEMDETFLDMLPTLKDGDILKISGRDVEIIQNPDRFFDVDQFIDESYEDFKKRDK